MSGATSSGAPLPQRTARLVGVTVFLLALMLALLYERRTSRIAQQRVDDLAALAEHYLWELDHELAAQSGQIIVDSEDYRRLRILRGDGQPFVDLQPEARPRWDLLLERLRLLPTARFTAPLVHRDERGGATIIGMLEVERRDTDLFVYLQAALIATLGGVILRASIERRRQVEATQRLQLLQERTDRLEAEARLAERETQLQEKRNLEALGRLAAGVAHDFNNVLTVVITSAEMLGDDAQDPVSRGQVQAILDAADRAAGLTRQLLAFGRRQVMEPRRLDLNEVIRSFRQILERAAGDQVLLELDLAPTLGVVEADPSQIEQVLLNLVVNARDAMPGGGRITIETRDADGPRSVGSGAPLPIGRWVVLAVHDTGQGMDAQTLARAFTPFFTTRPEGKGTGLGLATVYGITHQSGGEVMAMSQPGQGTTITVALPRLPGTASPLPQPPRTIPPGELVIGTTVMVVDDRRQVREVMAKALRSHGMQVLEAEDGLMALTLAREAPVGLHALITDLTMPGISGIELARRMRSDAPDLRVLFVSGDAAEVLPEGFTPDDRTAILHKPFGGAQLVAQVVALLEPGSG